MNHASLFSGIGGFDLAAEWMCWENSFHCEWNDFGQRVLKYYWPKAISYGDITKTDFTIWRGRIDVLSGGFPCQGFSLAGQRLGTNDYRYLWPEMLRCADEIRPRIIVGENVTGILSMEDKSDGNDGLSAKLDGITFSKWRQESIKAGGNAVVPQVVYQIFRAIEQYEKQTHSKEV